MKHFYQGSGSNCVHKDEITGDVCGLRKKNLIHKVKHILGYKVGEVVGKYVVGENGEFHKIKEG